MSLLSSQLLLGGMQLNISLLQSWHQRKRYMNGNWLFATSFSMVLLICDMSCGTVYMCESSVLNVTYQVSCSDCRW